MTSLRPKAVGEYRVCLSSQTTVHCRRKLSRISKVGAWSRNLRGMLHLGLLSCLPYSSQWGAGQSDVSSSSAKMPSEQGTRLAGEAHSDTHSLVEIFEFFLHSNPTPPHRVMVLVSKHLKSAEQTVFWARWLCSVPRCEALLLQGALSGVEVTQKPQVFRCCLVLHALNPESCGNKV